MLKFLLILAIAVYLISKVGRLLFGARMYSSQNRNFTNPPEGSVNSQNSKRKAKSTIKGGDYIDFEEVK